MKGSLLSAIGEAAFYVALAVLLVIFVFKKRKQLNSMKEYNQSEKPDQL